MNNSTNILLLSKASEYHHEYWDTNPIFFYYSRLQKYLETHFDDEFKHFFAFPEFEKVDSDYEITWKSNFYSNFIKLSDLDQDEYNKYRDILDSNLSKLNHLVEQLSTVNPDDAWVKIIEYALIADGDEAVYCAEDKVVLAPWGMTKSNSRNISSFKRKIFPIDTQSIHDNEDILSPNIGQSSFDKSTNLSNDGYLQNEDDIHEADNVQAGVDNSESEIEADDSKSKLNENNQEYNKDKSLKKWLKWLLWLLLFLLIVLLALWLLPKACSGALASNIKLPNAPGIMNPVDPEDVVLSEDSVQYIVSDRVNILFKNKNVNLDSFANDLSQKFDAKYVEITYYDTIIKRIQLRIPKHNRNEFKERLKRELSNYDMILFDESVMQHNKIPNDQSFNFPEQSWYFEPIQAIEAWDTTTGNDNLLAVVIDAGFDVQHEDLKAKNIKSLNVIDKSDQVFGSNNIALHGTHVYGTMTSTMSNQKGSTGIAPSCQTMVIRVTDDNDNMTTTAVVDAVLYAIHNKADVVNISLGMMFSPLVAMMPDAYQYSFIQNQLKEEEYLWQQVFAMADENNTTVILAGGNQSIMIGMDPMQRSPNTINVSSVNQDLKRSNFSNFGKYATISAPGEKIYNTVPGNKYQMLDGTSMAAPIVTGGIILIKSVYPNLTNAEIKNLLQNTGKPLSTDKPIGPLLQLANALQNGNDKNITDGKYTNPNIPPAKRIDSIGYDNPISNIPPLQGNNPISENPEFENLPEVNCSVIDAKIDSLKHLIVYYENQCGVNSPPISGIKQDTLKLPQDPSNKQFLHGRWKSTTSIFNDNNEEVVLYFDFYANGQDKLTMVEVNGNQCNANLITNINQMHLSIDQPQSALCQDQKIYAAYKFDCIPNKNGVAQCKAQNKDLIVNNFEFNLVRVK